ncbi:MAG TPA: DUF4238 domain-containing protein, partial [Thermohalobaculum sp.]|nr:DUF4238 domain-containing protein [Thermohalobaculum sp.]
YYYSQPMLNGGIDHNALEDLFSKAEATWPGIMRALGSRENVNDLLESIFAFIGLQRARVPAARDAVERLLAEQVKATARRLYREGKLPPMPEGAEDLLDHLEVAIDPHQSIHAMAHIVKSMGRLFYALGIGVLVNQTSTPFLSSDNPVIWFDPTFAEGQMRPYNVKLDGQIMLLFPVGPDLLIYGDNHMKERFKRVGLEYFDIDALEFVLRINRQICRFANEAVFAQKPGQEAMIRKYANVSPMLKTDIIDTAEGEVMNHRTVFGQRRPKARWPVSR